MISQADLLQQYRVFITQNNVTDLEAAISLARWVEQMHDDDTQLGALIRAGLEQGISVHRLESGKYMCSTHLSWCATADTPEDALKVAGVVLGAVA